MLARNSAGRIAELDPPSLQVVAELPGLKAHARPLLQAHAASPDGQLALACKAVSSWQISCPAIDQCSRPLPPREQPYEGKWTAGNERPQTADVSNEQCQSSFEAHSTQPVESLLTLT